MNNLYDNPVGLLFYYIYTFINTYNYFLEFGGITFRLIIQAWSKLCGKVDSDVHLFSVT